MIHNHDLLSQPFPGYQLLDSGNAAKLERIGEHVVQRPTPQAIWQPACEEHYWQQASSICERGRDGGGSWQHRHGVPGELWAQWSGPHATCHFRLGFTGFGHCGMFPEQAPVWAWLQERVQGLAAPRIANLFAYTGCGSIALAAAGAQVFHVDSAKGILQWCQDNIAANPEMTGSVRCVHEDARAFLRFARKRGFRYHGIVMDPPAWGHGKGKERWTIESDLQELLRLAADVLEPDGFIHLSCHTPGIQEAALVNCLRNCGSWGSIAHGEFTLAHSPDQGEDPRVLPAGIYACADGWQASAG
ncbi:MAG: hypothetical protein EA401_14785 [Planctomycetota bacterium]|nr:MAG: hypothetical protein EA401_14785 [Planctomycetota bacterium]